MSEIGNVWKTGLVAAVWILLILCVPVLAEEQKISLDNGGTHYNPRIEKNSVVWYEIDSNQGIYLYDLCSGTARKISGPSAVDPQLPDISGNRVIWMDYRFDDPWPGLINYDLSSNIETPLEHQPHPADVNPAWDFFSQINPSVSGTTVVYWTSNPWNTEGAGREIYIYSLDSGTFKFISSYWDYGGITNEHPRISGKKIVWSDTRNGRYGIWLFDLDTNGPAKIISPSDRDAKNPDISGNLVVWEEESSAGTADIILYDISSQTMTKITDDPADQRNPAVSGHRVVWDDDRNYQTTGLDIWRYDTIAKRTDQITTEAHDQRFPDVSAGTIVWQDNRDGSNIYMIEDSGVAQMTDIFLGPNALTCLWYRNKGFFSAFGSIFFGGSPQPTPQATPTPSDTTTSPITETGFGCSCTPTSGKPPLAVGCRRTGTLWNDGTVPQSIEWHFSGKSGDWHNNTGDVGIRTYTEAGNYQVFAEVRDETNAVREVITCAEIVVYNANVSRPVAKQPPSCLITVSHDATGTVYWGDRVTLWGVEDNCTAGLRFRLQKKPIPDDQAGPGGVDIGTVPAGDGYRFVFDTGAVKQRYSLTDGEYIVFIANAAGSEYTKVLLPIGTPSTTAVITTTITPTRVSNRPPVAAMSASPLTGTVPLVVGFDASASYDPDGTIARYVWTAGNTEFGSGKTATYSFRSPGMYAVGLTVTDDDGAVGRVTKTINAKAPVVVNTTTITPAPANKPPVAVISASATSGTAPLTVKFDAGKSTDSDGTIRLYNWAFTKTALASGRTVSYTFGTPGTYTATLTVTDDDWAVGTATKTITVSVPDLSHR